MTVPLNSLIKPSKINAHYVWGLFNIGVYSLAHVLRHMKDEQSKEIEDSVLDRCIPHGGVVHLYVDRRSPFVSQKYLRVFKWVGK